MKKIGIIGAMQEEIDTLIPMIEDMKIENISHLPFYIGAYNDIEVIVVRCGVGKVNAAMCTQILVDKFNPDYVINIGVAGAVSDVVSIGDIVLSTYLVEHDFDCTAFGYEKGIIPRLESSKFIADDELLKIAEKSKNILSDINFFNGVIVSGDVFVSSKAMKDDLYTRYGAMCTEMEGASIAHVCHLNSKPFLVIRSMSDKADGDAPENFNDFVLKSAENSKLFIQEMIRNM
ncbi:MTA/SAH nucleosidase [Peptostreptococcaceae bacterium AS15]|nr:MTA/SAH nucleosidase [Peptostreptococcaceae bacterium AS15]